jgi:hypothetical protein
MQAELQEASVLPLFLFFPNVRKYIGQYILPKLHLCKMYEEFNIQPNKKLI